MTDDRTLYMSTDHALYRARPGDDGRWRAEGLALAGLGGVRGLLIDPDDPRRWWACTADRGVLATRSATQIRAMSPLLKFDLFFIESVPA